MINFKLIQVNSGFSSKCRSVIPIMKRLVQNVAFSNTVNLVKKVCIFSVFISLVGCSEESSLTIPEEHLTTPIPDGFLEIPEELAVLRPFFHKYISVFGVHTVSSLDTPVEKHLHLAHVLAQWLDSDQDGTPNNPEVVNKLKSVKAWNGIVKNEQDVDPVLQAIGDLDTDAAQELMRSGGVLWSTEINPPSASFDPTIEEILHLVTQQGYSRVYSDLKEEAGSKIALAMDLARGGHFEQSSPDSCRDSSGQCAQPPGGQYPSGAWYTYQDQSCDYSCMITEYYFWALTSMLGANQGAQRCERISHEWPLCTRELVETKDVNVFRLMTNSQYSQPTVLPDGTYGGPASVFNKP
tara:strand:+ start:6645 stop:7700 length:1056 start_codon:yes stop_codon:yes gene_type:complete